MGTLTQAFKLVAALNPKGLITTNPLLPEDYDYFKSDLEYVAEAIPWGHGEITYEMLGEVTFMVEFYAGKENDGEQDYLYLENTEGEGFLFSCGWGVPASLNQINLEQELLEQYKKRIK